MDCNKIQGTIAYGVQYERKKGQGIFGEKWTKIDLTLFISKNCVLPHWYEIFILIVHLMPLKNSENEKVGCLRQEIRMKRVKKATRKGYNRSTKDKLINCLYPTYLNNYLNIGSLEKNNVLWWCFIFAFSEPKTNRW